MIQNQFLVGLEPTYSDSKRIKICGDI